MITLPHWLNLRIMELNRAGESPLDIATNFKDAYALNLSVPDVTDILFLYQGEVIYHEGE